MEKDNKDINKDDLLEDSPAEETPVEEAPVEEIAAEEAPVEEAAAEEAPMEETPAEEAAAEEAPVEEAAAEEAPMEEAPIEEAPVEEAAAEESVKESVQIPFIIGKKIGMTRLFDEEGISYPVTMIEAGPCYITQVKSLEKDGYNAVQIGYGEVAERKLNKPKLGHLNGKHVRYLKECKLNDINDEINVGGEVNTGLFEPGDLVNISGVSKGKGFAGHMKRHGFAGGRASHGKNSVMRKGGSIGAGSDPSKVWKGTRMAGRMGSDQVTVKNLQVVKINNDENTIFLSGAVPGTKNSIVYISKV